MWKKILRCSRDYLRCALEPIVKCISFTADFNSLIMIIMEQLLLMNVKIFHFFRGTSSYFAR